MNKFLFWFKKGTKVESELNIFFKETTNTGFHSNFLYKKRKDEFEKNKITKAFEMFSIWHYKDSKRVVVYFNSDLISRILFDNIFKGNKMFIDNTSSSTNESVSDFIETSNGSYSLVLLLISNLTNELRLHQFLASKTT